MTRLLALLACFALAGAASAQELTNSQKQACDRQERNLKEAQKKLADVKAKYADEMAQLKDMIIPPSFFEGYLRGADEVVSKCDAMKSDLDKSGCPADNARVKAITDWIAEAKGEVDKLKKDIEPRLAESRKIADPKNYPDLEKDFTQMEEIGKAYSLKDFKSKPDKTAELAREFASVKKWMSDRWNVYKPLIVITGGKKSALYGRYEKTANAVKAFDAAATAFVEEAKKDLPAALKGAEEMAAKAAAEKKPAFFTGGVRQKLDAARVILKVCEGLLPAESDVLKDLQGQFKGSQERIDKAAAGLKEQIIAETRAPGDTYTGADKDKLRDAVLAAWKAAYKDDKVLGVRFPVEGFDRTTKWVWREGDSSWEKVDRSSLPVVVIVQTSDRIATLYMAYVNIDHVSDKTTYLVQTKGSAYVIEEMLVENLK